MEKFKLTRPIRNAADTDDITEISIKSSDEVSASDFFGIKIPTQQTDGASSTNLGAMAGAIENIAGLTSSQVASLDIKDYIALSAIVGKYIGE